MNCRHRRHIVSDKWPTPLLDKACAEIEGEAKESEVPLPKVFPATLKHFLKLIVKARTPADSMARFRQFLRKESARVRPWFGEKSLTDDQRDRWVALQLESINAADKKGGFFNVGNWIGMGSSYLSWWQDQKSVKARESAKKRKKRFC